MSVPPRVAGRTGLARMLPFANVTLSQMSLTSVRVQEGLGHRAVGGTPNPLNQN